MPKIADDIYETYYLISNPLFGRSLGSYDDDYYSSLTTGEWMIRAHIESSNPFSAKIYCKRVDDGKFWFEEDNAEVPWDDIPEEVCDELKKFYEVRKDAYHFALLLASKVRNFYEDEDSIYIVCNRYGITAHVRNLPMVSPSTLDSSDLLEIATFSMGCNDDGVYFDDGRPGRTPIDVTYEDLASRKFVSFEDDDF